MDEEIDMADERHPQCVLVAPEMVGARALADWLTEKGFPAEPAMPAAIANPGDALGLTEEAFPGIEVRVVKPEHVEPARAAIAEISSTASTELAERSISNSIASRY